MKHLRGDKSQKDSCREREDSPFVLVHRRVRCAVAYVVTAQSGFLHNNAPDLPDSESDGGGNGRERREDGDHDGAIAGIVAGRDVATEGQAVRAGVGLLTAFGYDYVPGNLAAGLALLLPMAAVAQYPDFSLSGDARVRYEDIDIDPGADFGGGGGCFCNHDYRLTVEAGSYRAGASNDRNIGQIFERGDTRVGRGLEH